MKKHVIGFAVLAFGVAFAFKVGSAEKTIFDIGHIPSEGRLESVKALQGGGGGVGGGGPGGSIVKMKGPCSPDKTNCVVKLICEVDSSTGGCLNGGATCTNAAGVTGRANKKCEGLATSPYSCGNVTSPGCAEIAAQCETDGDTGCQCGSRLAKTWEGTYGNC